MAVQPTRLRQFLSELRRRKVIRVAIGYAIIGAGVSEAAANLLGPLPVPDWTDTLVAVLVILGFPIAVVLAWAFDITPRGIERTPDVSPVGADQPATRSVAPAAVSAAAPASAPAGSIATMPFANLSGDPSQDYLSDGLTEELLIALSRVPGLRVAARTSCFAFKQTPQDVREIGERLGVRHVLDGSVRVAGNRLRLSVQLVDVDTGFVLWTETYEREMDDIFAVQAEIARAVVQRVTRAEDAARHVTLAGPGTQNLEAFRLHLRGRYHWNRRREADLRRALGFFERAVATDPGYAAAWAGLADTYSVLLDYGGISPTEGLAPAREAVETALRLDPALAEAWTSLALVREFEWRWADAEEAFRRSIELQPDYATAHQRYALHLAWLGRGAEALREAERAESLDPLNVAVRASTGFVLYYGREFTEARARLEQAIEMDPHFPTARVALGATLIQLDAAQEAVAEFERAAADSDRSSSVLALLAVGLARNGDIAGCRRVRAELEERAKTRYVSNYQLALPAIALGEIDAAVDRLETACDRGAPQMIYIGREPLLDPLRSARRFRALLDRVGLDTV